MGTFSSVFRESLRDTLLVKGLQMTKQGESVREKNNHSQRQFICNQITDFKEITKNSVLIRRFKHL